MLFDAAVEGEAKPTLLTRCSAFSSDGFEATHCLRERAALTALRDGALDVGMSSTLADGPPSTLTDGPPSTLTLQLAFFPSIAASPPQRPALAFPLAATALPLLPLPACLSASLLRLLAAADGNTASSPFPPTAMLLPLLLLLLLAGQLLASDFPPSTSDSQVPLSPADEELKDHRSLAALLCLHNGWKVPNCVVLFAEEERTRQLLSDKVSAALCFLSSCRSSVLPA